MLALTRHHEQSEPQSCRKGDHSVHEVHPRAVIPKPMVLGFWEFSY